MITSPQNVDLRAAWFGQVSPDWKLGRAKNAFRMVSKKVGARSSEYDLLSLTLKGIIPRDLDSGKGKFPESFDTYQEVKRGDIVFCLFDIDETPRTVGLSDMDGMVTGAYTVVRCTELADPRYVTYFYLSIDERKGLRPFYTGLRKVVRTDTFLNAVFPLPDLATQRQIADFLDRETARIDLLIEKKQRLVALLGEERGATITSMVTGNEGSVPRTPKHSHWFSELPSDWALARVKHVTSKISDGPHISPEYVDEGIPFISARNIKVDRWSLDDAKYISPELFKELTKKSKPQVGDVLYTKGGTTGVARAVDLDFDFHIWVHVALLKLRKRICNPQFLAYALNSVPCYEQSQLATRGATNNDLGLSRIANIQIPLPPLDRQKEIVGTIDRSLSRIDSLTGTINASIDRLKEYRSALITAAVTGQIDVQTYAKSGTPDRHLEGIQEEMGA